MNSSQLVRTIPGLTYKRLDYWCQDGIFGNDLVDPGHYVRRSFSEEDIPVAMALARASNAINSRNGSLQIYRRIAELVREGNRRPDIVLGPGVHLIVDIDAPS